ncbi:MAG: M1 family metallopeptidase [Chloroflexota bacterium]|nr:M1 family metallopeptidase [Chloroflexota bacterium]MBI5703067.1 M1 family metallopeptidase [Chloroflexota bacterium]
MHKTIATLALLSFFFFLLAACSSPTPESIPPPETPVLPTETALPAESPTEPPPLPQPTLERPQYTIDLQLNYSTKAAMVNQTITYPNWTGETLTELVLSVQPNLWSGGFSLKSLLVDNQPITNYQLPNLNQRLEIPLPQPLPPGGTVTLTMTYGLILPQMPAYSNPNEVRPQIYGYSERQLNLVDWYPFVVPYQPGEGWILHNPWYYGEHLIYDTADFDVTVTFTDGSNPQVASSGAEVASGSAGSRRFKLEAGRTFALSISTLYKVAQRQVGDVTVYAYYFAFYDAPGEAMLQTTVEALQVFQEKFGPYRHKTMTAVQGDFNDGMEFSAFYFISRDYFNLYDNTPKNYLVIIAAHETAHQWWFDAVANDQALEPWLDETLCTYSERIYYETVHPDLLDWWWGYRYFEFQKAGFVDTPIYEGDGQRSYWDKTYLTGARFMEDLRQRVGDEIFFAFLRDYYTQFAGKHATAADFFRVFRENSAADISDLMAKYFQKTY